MREAFGDPDPILEIAKLKSLDAVTGALAKVKGGEEVGEPLRTAIEALNAMGLGDFVQVDLTIVRGLAYYTGIVFELFDAAKRLRAICGGGRYDDLLKALGGPDLPALGFGMGDVVLGELLKEQHVAPKASTELGAFLVAVSSDDVATVLQLAHTLRERGMAVEYGLRHAPIRKQLELAAARGAPRAVIIGPEERGAGVALVRDLKTGSEARVPLDNLLNGFFD
jgi:histidyl-tRNA synthetase